MTTAGDILKPQLFKFELNLKKVLWGGDKIAAFKGVTLEEHNVGESWEISGLKGHESIVSQGSDKGLSLRELITKYRGQLVGHRVYRKHGNEFPLLIKFIDARQNLSVQVHPDDDLARRRHGCSGKTEMWYIIDAQPGATLLAGMSHTITPQQYLEHMSSGTLLDVLARHTTHPGDIFFLPSGRIHSIGAGNLLLEVQQASDITYRVYDFDRLDSNGKPRELHTELAKEAIDYCVLPDYRTSYAPVEEGTSELVRCPHFTTSLHRYSRPATLSADTAGAALRATLDQALRRDLAETDEVLAENFSAFDDGAFIRVTLRAQCLERIDTE